METLNAFYERLAFDLDDGNQGHFLSGWQCENSFSEDLLSAIRERASRIDHTKYSYFDDNDDLPSMISALHTGFGESEPQTVLCGCGSSALISAFVTYLRRRGVRKVYYVPPLYFTFLTGLEGYGIEAQPVSGKQPYEGDCSLELPTTEGSVLLLSDPVWYAGTPLSADLLDVIADWQRTTRSLVFVDGSLQYLPWNGEITERTSLLDPSLTFRLICPSKQLSIHGYRFAYLLLPASEERALAWSYANTVGPAGADSIAFAYESISAIGHRNIPRKLMALASGRYNSFITTGIITSSIVPSCGYFVFGRITRPLPENYTVIDGSYFGQNNFSGYMKINLLSPSIHLIASESNCI